MKLYDIDIKQDMNFIVIRNKKKLFRNVSSIIFLHVSKKKIQAYMATSRAQYNQQLLTDQYIKLQMAK